MKIFMKDWQSYLYFFSCFLRSGFPVAFTHQFDKMVWCVFNLINDLSSYNTIQYNTIQYNTIQYNTIQYNTIQYNTIQYNTIRYDTIRYDTIRYNAMQCNTIQYNTIQYNTIQYNTIQYNPSLLILPEGFFRINLQYVYKIQLRLTI